MAAIRYHSDLMETFRQNLIRARMRRALSQGQLALKLGLSRSFVCQLESGARVPRMDTLDDLAGALGVSAASLLSFHE